MKKIIIKILFIVIVIFALVFYFKFRDLGEDVRMTVLAAHTCSWDGVYNRCGGYNCDIGKYCKITSYSCNCVVYPTIAPTKVVTETCANNSDGDNTCNGSGTPYCTQGCDDCPDGYTGIGRKTVTCWTSLSCKNNGWGYCSVAGGIDSSKCGWCPPNLTPTMIPGTCQPITCESTCGYEVAGCPDGCGNKDNCGGYGCEPCGDNNADPTPVVHPTAVPGCQSCEYQSCRDTVCSDQTCLGDCDEYCYGALTCTSPVFDSLVITNASGSIVSADVNGRNNICEHAFSDNASPRTVVFRANVTDLEGYSNIDTVELFWNGLSYNLDFVSGSGNDAVYEKTVEFLPVQNDSGTYPLMMLITDDNGRTSGLVSSNREWKVWNCQMAGIGYLYDGSSGQVCDTTGFTSLVENDFGFSDLLFRNAGIGLGVSAIVNIPDYFTVNNLVWGRTYLPIFNGGDVSNPNGSLATASRMLRVIDLGTGTTSCPVTDEFDIGSVVSAYSVSPAAQIDFSFIKDSLGWFQVTGAGVKAKNEISSGVPLTANASIRALSISNALADNGLVSFSTFTNINGYNADDAYGLTNNWWIDRNTNDPTTYSYQYFYNNFFINRDMGVTGPDWTSKPSNGIYFVNGNLNIDSDFSLASGEIFMVVARGNITIADTVNRLDGIYIADGGITASGTSSTQLVINGMLYSRNNIRLSRSYTDIVDNNSNPAVLVNYQPSLIFNMPGTLMRVLSGWREE